MSAPVIFSAKIRKEPEVKYQIPYHSVLLFGIRKFALRISDV